MSDKQTLTTLRSLRLWPGVLIIVLQSLAIGFAVWLDPGTFSTFMVTLGTPVVGVVLLAAWWLACSRLSRRDRLLLPLSFLGICIIAYLLSHPSLTSSRGSVSSVPLPMYLIIYPLPMATTLGLLWLLASFRISWPIRRLGLVLVPILPAAFFVLMRLDGTDGGMAPEWAWRWQKTAEERFLAELGSQVEGDSSSLPPPPLEPGPHDWPAFRGKNRNSRLTGVQIETNWAAQKPKEVWRKRVGPGWSSMSVIGPRLFTQEQRGDDETVVCYLAESGEQL